jgi:hypothetical protein
MTGALRGFASFFMAGKKDDTFSIFVPQDDAEQEMPERLELVDSGKGGKPKQRLKGGAYDPYQKQEMGNPSDTARIRKPRVDLRKLSEWIKATQRVKVLREEDMEAQADPKEKSGK